jgi:atypical dual specificity phosphatase
MINTISEQRFNFLAPVIPSVNQDKTAAFAQNHPVFSADTCYYPLLKGLGLALLLGLAIVTIILTNPVGLYFIPILVLGTIALLPFAKEGFKKLLFEISLIWTRITAGKDNWMHRIHEGLYLGGIPLNDYGHVQVFKAMNISKIVSLVEAFEQNSKTFGGTPVSHKQWEEAGIEQILLETPDFSAPSKECLKAAVKEIREARASGKNVYVHCKAGRGRSATAFICYLLEYVLPRSGPIGMDEVEVAIRYVQNIRSQIHLGASQKQAVIDYFI